MGRRRLTDRHPWRGTDDELVALFKERGGVTLAARAAGCRRERVKEAVVAAGLTVEPAGGRERPLHDRLLEKVLVDDETGCWLWQASIRPNGYGQVYYNGRPHQAHRVVYEAFVGPIPDSLTLDHLCRVRDCVNPEHMEPVTLRENILRGDGLSARRARQTHCIHGHEFTPENLYRAKRGRVCRRCDRIRRGYEAA